MGHERRPRGDQSHLGGCAMKTMRDTTFMVVGSSLFACAMALELLDQGADVVLLDPSSTHPGISMTLHDERGKRSFELACSDSYGRAATTATILLPLVGPELEQACLALAPHLHDGHVLVVFPAYFMASTVQRQVPPSVHVAEMTSSPVVCDWGAEKEILIHKRKQRLKIGGCTKEAGNIAMHRLGRYLPMLVLATGVVETSLENINTVLHPLPILTNLVAVQRDTASFRHFFDGIDEHVSSLMHALDDERLAVGNALGLKLEPALDQLKSYYGNNAATTIFEYIHSPDCPYGEIRGFGLDSRYIRLDIPALLVPTIALARQLKVAVPLHEACAALAAHVT